MDNFWYLFAAYSVVWVVLFGYICLLYTKQRKLGQELEALAGKLDSRKT